MFYHQLHIKLSSKLSLIIQLVQTHFEVLNIVSNLFFLFGLWTPRFEIFIITCCRTCKLFQYLDQHVGSGRGANKKFNLPFYFIYFLVKWENGGLYVYWNCYHWFFRKECYEGVNLSSLLKYFFSIHFCKKTNNTWCYVSLRKPFGAT